MRHHLTRAASWPKCGGFLLFIMLAVAALPSVAQTQSNHAPFPPDLIRTSQDVEDINQQRVGIVTGQADLAYVRIGNDLARLVDTDERPSFRAVIQLGYGSMRNLDDLRNLRNVDLAIVQSDVFEAYKNSPENYAELDRYVRIVATLYKEKVHILARGDIHDIRSLVGKRVNIGIPGSGHNMTARNLFRKFDVQIKFDEQNTTTAIRNIVDNALDAVFFVAGGSMKAAADINYGIVYSEGLHFLPINDESGDMIGYEPARISVQDYDTLARPFNSVPTLSVESLLVARAWENGDPRNAAVERFIDRFFKNSAELVSSDFSPGTRLLWCQADLSGSLKGWKRLPYADKWLDDHKDVVRALQGAGGKDCS
jgi:TRAP transporter TAXI family solute receptor